MVIVKIFITLNYTPPHTGQKADDVAVPLVSLITLPAFLKHATGLYLPQSNFMVLVGTL